MDSAKVLRSAFRASSCLGHAYRISRGSSTYCTIEKSVPHLSGIGRVGTPLCIADFRMLCNKSTTRTKSRGGRGPPCLTPLLQWKTLFRTPFNNIADVPDSIIIFNQCCHFAPKPLCCIILMIASCSILSKVFSKSSFRITIYFLEALHR
jgi:hypothetical protein